MGLLEPAYTVSVTDIQTDAQTHREAIPRGHKTDLHNSALSVLLCFCHNMKLYY